MSLPSGLRAEIRLHQEVKTFDDEWSGITNPVIRRKLQNRLNQRAARRRRAEQKVGTETPTTNGSSRDVGLKHIPLHERIDLNDIMMLRTQQISSSAWNTAAEALNSTTHSPFVSIRAKNTCQRWYEVRLEERLVSIKDLAAKLQQDRENTSSYQLPADHLISLVYYNVYRALIMNVQLLGLDPNLMYSDDYPSPFLPLSHSSNSSIHRLPPTLQPTELQKTIAHHPMWDLFPDSELRDNVLRYGEDNIDDVQLCLDLVGDGNYTSSEDVDCQNTTGMIVWGEPWDAEGWEVTASFTRRWPLLIRGAFHIQNSSNKWRMQRGAEPLDFDRILEVE